MCASRFSGIRTATSYVQHEQHDLLDTDNDRYAYDKGIHTFDTANTYSDGESEVILGKFLKQHQIPRESVVILTKTYNPDGTAEERGPAGLANQRGLNRKVRCLVPSALSLLSSLFPFENGGY